VGSSGLGRWGVDAELEAVVHAEALKAALRAGGYLAASRVDAVDADFALGLMRMAIKWYAVRESAASAPLTPGAIGTVSVPTATSGPR
jgi:hypothetical protein